MLMKIKVGDKNFSVTTVTSALTREAFAVNRDAITFAKQAQSIQQAADNQDFDALEDVMDQMLAIKDRKAALICKVYGEKFSVDELENNATDAEIDAQINLLISNLNGAIRKK